MLWRSFFYDAWNHSPLSWFKKSWNSGERFSNPFHIEINIWPSPSTTEVILNRKLPMQPFNGWNNKEKYPLSNGVQLVSRLGLAILQQKPWRHGVTWVFIFPSIEALFKNPTTVKEPFFFFLIIISFLQNDLHFFFPSDNWLTHANSCLMEMFVNCLPSTTRNLYWKKKSFTGVGAKRKRCGGLI